MVNNHIDILILSPWGVAGDILYEIFKTGHQQSFLPMVSTHYVACKSFWGSNNDIFFNFASGDIFLHNTSRDVCLHRHWVQTNISMSGETNRYHLIKETYFATASELKHNIQRPEVNIWCSIHTEVCLLYCILTDIYAVHCYGSQAESEWLLS